ncbi:hypothetical protein N7G274_002697 [Stereocaulon virgatum]|uniref:Uncharacterized protein n=1 Tax=Stereocaulon virgatum TaxID=373712 RepID=A0ABR4AGI9_9LECA
MHIMFRSLPILALILAQYSAITLAAPEPYTNVAMGLLASEASAEMDTALSNSMMPRDDTETKDLPSIVMERRQYTHFIEQHGRFNLPCNISAVNVTLAVKHAAPQLSVNDLKWILQALRDL